MQKSQAEIDGITLLQLGLDELFKKTAVDCATKMMQYWDSPPEIGADGTAYMSSGGDSIVVNAVGDWREKSLDRITEGFHCLLQATPRSLSSRAARDRAAELTWEAIDRVYGWVDGRLKTGRFREWFMEAGAQSLDARNTPMDFDLPLMHGECKVNKRTYVQLSCDSRRMFENRLAALRLGSLLPVTAPSEPQQGDSINAELVDTAVPGLRHPWYYEDGMGDRRATINIPKRGKLVDDLKKEIRQYRGQLDELSSHPTAIANRWPECITFNIYARATDNRRRIFKGCITDGKYEQLAYELAADVAPVGVQAMKKAWSEYRRQRGDKKSSRNKDAAGISQDPGAGQKSAGEPQKS